MTGEVPGEQLCWSEPWMRSILGTHRASSSSATARSPRSDMTSAARTSPPGPSRSPGTPGHYGTYREKHDYLILELRSVDETSSIPSFLVLVICKPDMPAYASTTSATLCDRAVPQARCGT